VRTIVKGKNVDVAPEDRRYAERKMARLSRLLDDRTDAIVELSHEQRKSLDDSHIAEVTLIVNGRPLRGVARASTYHAALDEVVDKLDRQAVEHREKPRLRARAPGAVRDLLRNLADGSGGSGADAEPDTGPAIVKVKRFAIEPMFEEDAVARMEELGHSFFVFVNAENERLGVLYRRRDGAYGLIEPTVGGDYTAGRGQSGQSSTGRRR
jgi:ribosome hibernation promoting factor